ncbi:MAG: 23S rRNA (adenine(2030)-N(6))-methyltransferase RlmJ [Sterolibacterium sp.]
MLSYRHAFHAGNHADVLKHFLLVQLIRHLEQKDAPFWYFDSHAGAGLYALDTGYATQLAEYAKGIERLWSRDDLPAPLAAYVELARALNPDGKLRIYPGSPWIAWQTLRPQDRLRLFELHSRDSQLLQDNFRAAGRRVTIQAIDGFAGIQALLPPAPRRALVLIDPSYEDKRDYRSVAQALEDGMKRFATGMYAIWYPQLPQKQGRSLVQRNESRLLPEKLKTLAGRHWLHVRLTVSRPAPDAFGMYGSGMFIANPPWTLHDTLKEVMPYLAQVLGQDDGASFLIEQDSG